MDPDTVRLNDPKVARELHISNLVYSVLHNLSQNR